MLGSGSPLTAQVSFNGSPSLMVKSLNDSENLGLHMSASDGGTGIEKPFN